MSDHFSSRLGRLAGSSNLSDLLRPAGSAQMRTRSLIVAGVALGVFVLLLPVALSGTAPAFDQAIRSTLPAHATPSLDAAMALITMSGRGKTLGAIDVLVCLLTLWLKGRRHAVFIGASVALAGVFLVVAKRAVARVRPDAFSSLVSESSYSFPSAHAMGTMALVSSLTVVFWPTRWRWPVVAIGAAWLLVIGFSRVYLGVHWPSDVIGGWAAGLGCVALVVARFDPRPFRHERRRSPERW